MACNELPPVELLRKHLDYNPATGILYWRPRLDANNRFNTRYAGNEAGMLCKKDGYRKVNIGKVWYYSHRVIWKMVHGSDPEFIDHIDGARTNNRLHNLRSVTEVENRRNARLSSANTSGVMGVEPDRRYGGWVARIKVGGKGVYLGKFYDFDKAVACRKAAEARYGFHPNHGRA